MTDVDFTRERAWWDAKAPREEGSHDDSVINRALRWREIERHLQEVETILDVGGATGAFSIPLARRGFQVTHLDLSPEMLRLAREKAGNLKTVEFIEGNAVNLPFPDRSFDLVLNMDGAISFCGSGAVRAVEETCRVAAKKVIVSVSSRAAMVCAWLNSTLEATGRVLPAAYAMLERGEWDQDQFPENDLLTKNNTGSFVPSLRAFMPGELQGILEQRGMSVLRVGGLGTLAKLCGKETVARVLADEELFDEFLDLCERYDSEILPDGPGTDERAGLIAIAGRVQV